MKLEVWKDIEDYPNYQVSTFGNVKSKRALLKRWRPEQFEAIQYKVGE